MLLGLLAYPVQLNPPAGRPLDHECVSIPSLHLEGKLISKQAEDLAQAAGQVQWRTEQMLNARLQQVRATSSALLLNAINLAMPNLSFMPPGLEHNKVTIDQRGGRTPRGSRCRFSSRNKGNQSPKACSSSSW